MKLIPITYPWEVVTQRAENTQSPASVIPWHFQVITNKENKLLNAVTGATFPHRQVDGGRTVYEIHGPAVRGELAQSVLLSISDNTDLTLTYRQHGEFGGQNKHLRLFEPFFDQVMDTMLVVLREGLKNEKFELENHYWPEIIINHLRKKTDDPANYSLVVDLARPKKLIESLQRISDRPKRILRRIHDQERVQKVQEIDKKCMMDLARRPGAVLAEKAGPKQRILAIRRTESIDTLENRVSGHCCELVTLASRRYLKRNIQYTAMASDRVRSVEKLQRIAQHIPHKDSFQGVRRLLEPCRQPNYTLLQNADYYRMWTSYVELVRNEDLRNQLWMWHRRLWVDYMKIYLSSILYTFMTTLGPESMRFLGNKTILSDRRHRWGSWLLDDSLPGPFIIEPDSDTPTSLYVTDGSPEVLSGISPKLAILASLNADILIIASRDGELKVIPVYGLLPSHHLDDTAHAVYLEEILPSMMKAVRSFNLQFKRIKCLGAWTLLGNWHGNDVPSEAQNLREQLTCWITSVPAKSSEWTETSSSWEKPLFKICGY